MDTSLTVRNMRRESWAHMLHEQAASGLSVREWCKQNQLSVKSFYYRRRQVQAMVLDAAQDTVFAEVIKPKASVPISDKKNQKKEYRFTPQLTISAGDFIIGVSQDTPSQLLTEVLQVIRNA